VSTKARTASRKVVVTAARFEVITAMLLKIQVFWNIALCRLGNNWWLQQFQITGGYSSFK